MTLRETLSDFAGSVGAAATRAPDDYAEWEYWTFESHMADIRELWAKIRPQLHRDAARADALEATLQAMIAAFEGGDKGTGRKLALDICRMEVETWR